jgi:hypothetical protein
MAMRASTRVPAGPKPAGAMGPEDCVPRPKAPPPTPTPDGLVPLVVLVDPAALKRALGGRDPRGRAGSEAFVAGFGGDKAALKAHMLSLAARSAEVRRQRRAAVEATAAEGGAS